MLYCLFVLDIQEIVSPVRLLTVVPLCDGHDSAISAVNQELIGAGFEVIYMGYHRSAEDIVRAAIQEDVVAIGISSYNGGHIEFFSDVLEILKSEGRLDIGVFGGGGGTITPSDARVMQEYGVDEIFLAGTPFSQMIERLQNLYGGEKSKRPSSKKSCELGQILTEVENDSGERREPAARGSATVIGITGPGGAGKTTLIDEWIRGALEDSPELKVAVLLHDPSRKDLGGLLGDRATMVYSQSDQVYIRSMATRGRQGGLSSATIECLRWLASEEFGFDLVLVETVGVGQEALPFEDRMIDKKLLVLHPEYGAKLQLQKILMLGVADAVVVNKSDWAGATRAREEVGRQLRLGKRGDVSVYITKANEHKNAGVRKLREGMMR